MTYAILYGMSEFVYARNTVDGSVGKYRERLVAHPVLGKFLEEVPEGTKPRKKISDLVSKRARKAEQVEADIVKEDV